MMDKKQDIVLYFNFLTCEKTEKIATSVKKFCFLKHENLEQYDTFAGKTRINVIYLMKPLSLNDLTQTAEMSLALHLCLSELHQSELNLTARRFCRIAGLSQSDLTRMRLAHQRPHYSGLISKRVLRKVLQYLLDQFPTLMIFQNQNGEMVVHLYRYYNGKRLRRSLRRLRPPLQPFRTAPRQGTTRWFLKMSV